MIPQKLSETKVNVIMNTQRAYPCYFHFLFFLLTSSQAESIKHRAWNLFYHRTVITATRPFSLLDCHCILDSIKSFHVLRGRAFDNGKSYLVSERQTVGWVVYSFFQNTFTSLCSLDSRSLSSWVLNDGAEGKA